MAPHSVAEEKKLVERCLKGDQRAWEELAETSKGIVISVIKKSGWGFQPHDQDDLVQELNERLITALKRFKFDSKLGTFIFTIAQRVCTDEFRRRTAMKRDKDKEILAVDSTGGAAFEEGRIVMENPGPKPDRQLLLKEKTEHVFRAIESLSRACKEIIRLRSLEDIPFKEISEMLNETKNTLIQRHRRCLLQVRAILKEQGYC